MNIVELVKAVVQEYPRIDELHIDNVGVNSDDFGLYPTGDKPVKTDVLGNETREHTFILYAVFQSFNDYDRLSNSGFMLELQSWLEHYKPTEKLTFDNGSTKYTGQLNKLNCSNGMLYNIPDNNTNSCVQYQMQITAEYKIIESEE